MSPRLLSAGGGLRRVLDVLGDDRHDRLGGDDGAGPLHLRLEHGRRSARLPAPRMDRRSGCPGSRTSIPDDRDRVMEAWTKAAEGERLDVEYRFANEGRRRGQALAHRPAGARVRPPDDERLRGLIVDVTETTPTGARAGRGAARRERGTNPRGRLDGGWRRRNGSVRSRSRCPRSPTSTRSTVPRRRSSISEQTTTILGYPPEEWYTDPELWTKIVHPDDKDRLEAAERSGGLRGRDRVPRRSRRTGGPSGSTIAPA